MTVRARPAAWLLAAVLALSWTSVRAGPADTFVPVVDVRGTKLQLNGAGTRYKTIFKVYDVALYTTRKVGSADELLALPGPKKLSFVALRELAGDEVGRLMLKDLSDNCPQDQVRRHEGSAARLLEIFARRAKMVSGERFAMEFVPGEGTRFYIADQVQGQAVGDEEFFQMLLKGWVGRSPGDVQLRDALLGKRS